MRRGAALALAAVCGCSLVNVNGPPTGWETRRRFECTTSVQPPLLDSGALVVLGTISVYAFYDETMSDSDQARLVSSAGLAALLAAASAAYGFSRTHLCRCAQAQAIPVEPAPSAPAPAVGRN